jgi:hypothetical protein
MTPKPFEKRPMSAERRHHVRHRTNIETLWLSIAGHTSKGPIHVSRTEQILRRIQGS